MAYPALAYPLRVIGGRFVTVAGDSAAHVETQAEIVLRTPRGTMEAAPTLGLADLVGTMGPVGPALLEALSDSVPGASFVAEELLEAVVARVRDVTIERSV